MLAISQQEMCSLIITNILNIASCPDNFLSYNGNCYGFSRNEKLKWDEARTKCQEIGYDLVVINDEAENEFLKNHVASSHKYFWIGLRENEAKDSFVWIDGSDFIYGNTWNKKPWDRKKPASVVTLFLCSYISYPLTYFY